MTLNMHVKIHAFKNTSSEKEQLKLLLNSLANTGKKTDFKGLILLAETSLIYLDLN